MCQTRGRLYIIMIRDDVADNAQIMGMVRLIKEVLPQQIVPGSSIEDILEYVWQTHEDMGPLKFPPIAKETWE